MSHRRLPLKIAAVCFSVLMLSGYVYLRAGGDPQIISGSKFARVAVPPATQTTILLSGSKSDQVLPGSKGGILLSGSKSFTLTTETGLVAAATSASTQSTRDRVL